jgi:hypothetical protein
MLEKTHNDGSSIAAAETFGLNLTFRPVINKKPPAQI